ncbi:hypothetical protein MOQ_008690, partial [Trypanosoma cruzi marinkellei]
MLTAEAASACIYYIRSAHEMHSHPTPPTACSHLVPCCRGPSHKDSRHRTTARRGHTPAAHGQSSSSPSLLSLACSLQHKITPRQRRAEAKKRQESHNHAPSHPATSVTHYQDNNYMGKDQQQSKHKNSIALLATAPFPTLPQSLLLSFPLLRPSQTRHSHFNTHPSSTGLGIVGPSQHTQSVMRSRCAATYAIPFRSPAAQCPPRPSQSPACHGHTTHTAPQCRAATPPQLWAQRPTRTGAHAPCAATTRR